MLWRPELGFFEERSGLLRDLESANLLDEFRWTTDDVTIKIGQHEGLTVGVNGATAYVASPSSDGARTRMALQKVLETLKPRDAMLQSVNVQWFIEVGGSPTAVQANSADQLMADWMPSVNATDWAILLDGTSRRVPGKFQVEFGVVSAAEGHFRISAPIGRVALPELPFSPDPEGLPECAFFFNWAWQTSAVLADEPFLEALGIWEAVLSETELLSNEVKASYLGMRSREEEHG